MISPSRLHRKRSLGLFVGCTFLRHGNDGRSRRNSFAIFFCRGQSVSDPGIRNEVPRVHRIGFYLFS
jgi:hypothetical protein